MDDQLTTLKQRWLVSRSFQDEQAYLVAKVQLAGAQFVFLDPDGTLHDWLGVVVRGETGVIYVNQCAGTATEQRLVEGHYVPLGGSKHDVDAGSIELVPFNEVFHENGGCCGTWQGHQLPRARLTKLQALVEEIPYWSCTPHGQDRKDPLQLDVARIDEIAEGWIPVTTPCGQGVLVYQNCD